MADKEQNSSLFAASTNWVVSQGSLDDSISVESLVSLTEDYQADYPVSPLLVLAPESPDSIDPCEITVSFQQKYEVFQIYVKSTAKIYEIYYVINEHSDNEYLCTVRCGVVAEDEEVLDNSDAEEMKEKCGNEMKSSEEDGWVEVKKPNLPLNEVSDYKLKRNIGSDTRMGQDYYEATAEITDPSPCITLTLRLLSLQGKGCVQIKEIYIFANPVESPSSVPQISSGNSTGSSLLAMLVPGLLQASRSGSNFMQDVKHYNPKEKEQLASADQEGIKPVIIETGKEKEARPHLAGGKEVKNQEPFEGRSEQGQFKKVAHTPVSEERSFDLNNIERALNQLDYRMSRMEAFCLRFEETMLKPLNGIEGRLQRLEQQLDALKLRSEHNKIAAPEFSCDESGASSFYDEKCDNYTQDASRILKDSHLDDSSGLPDLSQDSKCCSDLQTDRSSACFHPSTSVASECCSNKCESFCSPLEPSSSTDLVGNPGTCPTLVMTAPEFPCDDEDKNLGGSSEALQGSAANKPSMSIDDALASALEAFLASTSVGLSNRRPTLRVRAPEFENEANYSNLEPFLPPTALLSEDPEKLLSSSRDDICGVQIFIRPTVSSCCNCIKEELEEPPRISEEVSYCVETAEVGVKDSCSQNEEGNPLENVRDYSSPCINITANDKANEFREVHQKWIQGAVATVVQNDDCTDLHRELSQGICGARTEEGYTVELHHERIQGSGASAIQDNHPTDLVSARLGMLMPDSIESLTLNEEDTSNPIDTFEQSASNCFRVCTGSDEGSSPENQQVSLNLDSDICDVKFVTREDWIPDAPLEMLLGSTSSTEVQSFEEGNEHAVQGGAVKDQIWPFQESQKPSDNNVLNNQVMMGLDNLNLVIWPSSAAGTQEILSSSSKETQAVLPPTSGSLQETGDIQ